MNRGKETIYILDDDLKKFKSAATALNRILKIALDEFVYQFGPVDDYGFTTWGGELSIYFKFKKNIYLISGEGKESGMIKRFKFVKAEDLRPHNQSGDGAMDWDIGMGKDNFIQLCF